MASKTKIKITNLDNKPLEDIVFQKRFLMRKKIKKLLLD